MLIKKPAKPGSDKYISHPIIPEHTRLQLQARRIEFITTAVICVVFAICFAHLEYYYIKDPALQISNGKVQSNQPEFDQSRETKPIFGNMYQ